MKSFRVASFNVENLLHPDVFFTGRADTAPYTPELYAEKLRWISGILDEGKPDLVGFQEVFSFQAIRDAVARSSSMAGATVVAPGIEKNENISSRLGGGLEAAGPNLALASRFPVMSAELITDFPEAVNPAIPLESQGVIQDVVRVDITRFERPIIKARVQLPGNAEVTVLVAHLKSKRPKFLPGEDTRNPVVQALGRIRSLIVRGMEAVALRAIVVRMLDNVDGEPGMPVILFGDLNDDLNSVTTQVVSGEEPPRFLRREQKLREWDILLYSVHDLQEALSYRNVSFTHIYSTDAMNC